MEPRQQVSIWIVNVRRSGVSASTIGALTEHLVIADLLSRGRIDAAMTCPGAPYDISYTTRTGRLVRVEVRSSQSSMRFHFKSKDIGRSDVMAIVNGDITYIRTPRTYGTRKHRRPRSERHRAAISVSQRGISRPHKGHPPSDANRLATSIRSKGNTYAAGKRTAEQRADISRRMMGNTNGRPKSASAQ